MSFAEGFNAGVNLGNSIKADRRARDQQTLDKAVQDWRVKQAGDELALQKEMAAQRTKQAADELDERRKGREWGESLDEYMANYKRERDAVADTRYDATDSRSRQTAVMNQLDTALETMRKNRMDRARIAAMQGRGGDQTTTTEELDPTTGEVMSTKRVTRAAGLPQPSAQPAAAPADPTAVAARQRIAALQQQIGEDKVQQAQGDNRYGFMNLMSRQGRIDDSNAEIGKLQPLTGAPGAAVPVQPRQPVNPQVDPQTAQALAWARANPDDPRAAAILQRVQAAAASQR